MTAAVPKSSVRRIAGAGEWPNGVVAVAVAVALAWGAVVIAWCAAGGIGIDIGIGVCSAGLVGWVIMVIMRAAPVMVRAW
jgi:hypothetical protein